MTGSAIGSDYFPYSIQIRNNIWERFSLLELHQDLKRSARPRIMFYRELASRLSSGGAVAMAGNLNLYSLQLAVQRHIVSRYLDQEHPELLPLILDAAGIPAGSNNLEQLAKAFCRLFPGTPFLDNPNLDPLQWIRGDGNEVSRQKLLVGEILILSVAASNRALESFRQVIDWKPLLLESSSADVASGIEKALAAAPPVAAIGLTLPEILRLPLKAAPDSLYEQLRFMKVNWQVAIPDELIPEILGAFAISEEEGRMFAGHGWNPGAAPVLEFTGGVHLPGTNDYYPEPERFSSDTDWMPNVVLLAKMVYVWLGQLAKKYDLELTRLDQIPDEELDLLAKRGVTGLWLIGLWERSPASQHIKQICGNPEAISSAYSLFDYAIAADLGGEAALIKLRDRALVRGIRLASDMVPNHTGLYSRWIVEHPDWFIQLEYPPYPAYTFTGVDLSPNPDISLHIEDGYWERRDAAVVFKHYDHRSGQTRYIYHGNDGSSTPWNDTAQLNYLNPEVREAVTGTILHVARLFPIIRFDAAMTLAKKHYQRLWFPQPGHGGIPSRPEHGMTRAEFDAAMPDEFWRQVVDRIAVEAPDTLLLAEAFWLMEGYFVRTLGMHRVYNSAFMNMLKMEENAKYRQTIRNVLEFNPEVLQRFVNFMNNPDEKTAVEQFGRESKYIGAAVLLVTMPGLPMIGHGQIEGYHEKYGMEYKKAYWDEPVDEHLVKEHEKRIFPLMRRRWLFSGADNFRFYDFLSGGHPNEDVFAYSNRAGGERAIVLYHNRFATVSGFIKHSVSYAVKNGAGDMVLTASTLGESLGLNGDGRHYYVYSDYADGCEYIRNGRELCNEGLRITLSAYDYHVLMDFREIWDDEFGTWGRLCHQLEGLGVASIDDEVKQIRFAGVIDILRLHLEKSHLLLADGFDGLSQKELAASREEFTLRQMEFFSAVAKIAGSKEPLKGTISCLAGELEFIEAAIAAKETILQGESSRLLTAAWLTLHRLGELDSGSEALEVVLEYGLDRPLEEELSGEAATEGDVIAELDVASVMALFKAILSFNGCKSASDLRLQELFSDKNVAFFIGLHESGGFKWFVKERWELLVDWLDFAGRISGQIDESAQSQSARHAIILKSAAKSSGYRLDRFLENMK
ncbi:MAG: alpha-amylase [Geobacteraceae bacterium]|nr:alpha-amylase [Geobacteraceae bacterium]